MNQIIVKYLNADLLEDNISTARSQCIIIFIMDHVCQIGCLVVIRWANWQNISKNNV